MKNKEITSRDEDFAKWYTDTILKTKLVDYAPIKGFMVIREYGYAIWELIQKELDRMFKESGHKNLYFPILIPESLLNKEKEHVEGFAPEVAWVTHGGEKKLEERLCIRPTSETIICTMYSKWLNSYRDLPFLYNQWANVIRWEKTTRPFLRTSEFLWQEGHTLHETAEEAKEETLKMLNIYKKFVEEYLAIPVITGRKSEKEKFAGAVETYTMEALMYDGQALQAGTSHFFGDGFAKAFDIKYLGRDNLMHYPFQTSWGVSTRLIGGLIMTHSDDNGLVLPPNIAPIQVIIIPINLEDEKVMTEVNKIKEELKSIRLEIDMDKNSSAGFKFNEWEMKGVPIRIEIGPKDVENGKCILARRDTKEKIEVNLGDIKEEVPRLLKEIQANLFYEASKRREEHTTNVYNMAKLKDIMENKPGYAIVPWCENEECENKIKEETGATIRCITDKEIIGKCICCGKEAKKEAYVARAY